METVGAAENDKTKIRAGRFDSETQPKRPFWQFPGILIRKLELVVDAVVELPFDVDVDGPRRLGVLPGDGRIDTNLAIARS